MKSTVVFTLLAVCVTYAAACSSTYPVHECVKRNEPEHCIAMQVCEKPHFEQCGHLMCQYPFVCAYNERTECKDFASLQTKCGLLQKTCHEQIKQCGHLQCPGNSDCVMNKVCKKVYVPYYSNGMRYFGIDVGHRRLAQAVANSQATAISHGAPAVANSDATALSVHGPALANSQATAVGMSGPAVANSGATAIGMSGPAVANSDATAISHGGPALAESHAFVLSAGYHAECFGLLGLHGIGYQGCNDYRFDFGHGCGYDHAGVVLHYREELICADEFQCVQRPPCQAVIVQKCVPDTLRAGIDVCEGGYKFNFLNGFSAFQKCGKEICGAGHKCADVIIKECGIQCGSSHCNDGFDCSYGIDVKSALYKDCENYAYLETICKTSHEPVCVMPAPEILIAHAPPCKTVYKCDVTESACGNSYCGSGFFCDVKYEPACHVVGGIDFIAIPQIHHEEPRGGILFAHEPAHDVALSSSLSHASPAGTATQSDTFASGDAAAAGTAVAQTPVAGSASLSLSDAANNVAATQTQTFSLNGVPATAGANAGTID